jgi:hypothetical protein
MAKIKELLRIQSSYSAQVDLKKEFNDRNLKEERMSNYKPIKAHRKAFEIIAEGAYVKNSKRCFILSGSYGTGKSHLLLMAANYFESQSDTKEMVEFFKNYSESEENESDKKAELLKKVRKERRYLVCICDYGANNFETYILRSVKDALAREGISEQELDSYYLQAINKINEWKASEDSYFYERLENLLESKNTSWTVNKLIQELSEFNKDAIVVFKDIHKRITTSDFEYERDNYVQIIEQLATTKLIRERFAGILILFDEFDYQLKGKRFDLDEFQKFGQMCAASFMNNFPVIFIATTHRSFSSYRSAYNTEDFLTVNDRIKEIPLETQGIEEIISAVVNPQKKSELWEKEIKPRVSAFNQLSNECTSLKIFDWLPAPKVRTRIIENIYPMHPMATFSLLKLASDVGSNNRSVFTFFADEKNDIGSYDWFVKSRDIVNSTGEIQFYTVDLLFEYFKDKINSDNQELRQTVKEYVRNFETSLRELSKNRSTSGNIELQDELFTKILRTMVIYQIIGIDINDRTLRFGLNMNTQDKEKELEYCLKLACVKKIIYLNETNHCYEFRRNDALDINGLIRDYKQVEENILTDIMVEIESIITQGEIKKVSKFFKDEYYLDPAKYNFTYKEDKRLIRKYCTVKDIENPNYYQKLLFEMEAEKEYKKSYEGIALYVFCETEDDIKKAKILSRKNPSNRIIIGIPIEEICIVDDIFSLKAAFAIDRKEFSPQDVGILKEQIQYYDSNLASKLKQYITSRYLTYYGEQGAELTNKANDDDAAAVKMLESIYESKRNKLNHEDLNKSHVFKDSGNTALREAVEILLDFNKPLSYRKDYAADRGDIKYIQNVLMQHGVIKPVQTIGNQVMCELEHNISKFSKIIPALASMLEKFKSISIGTSPQGFIEDYIRTYGIGYNAAILFFAVAKRYFKDSLIILPEAHDIGYLKITSYDSILDLLYHQKYKNAVIEYKQIEPHDEFFIRELYKVICDQSIALENTITLDQLYENFKKWYKGLNDICKVNSIYDTNKLESFIGVFNRIDSISARDFILEEIKTIYGYERQDLVLKETVPGLITSFKKDKDLIEQGYYIIREKIFAEIGEIFNSRESNYTSINQSINIWLEGLSDFQKSFKNELHNDDSKPLVMHLGKSNDCEELFMNTLPSAYNLGSVKTWVTNKMDSYTQKIKAGKIHIEQGLYSVNPPEYKLYGKDIFENCLSDTNFKISYSGSLKLEIIPCDEHKNIYITSNGNDPKDVNSQREERESTFIFDTKDDKTIRFCGVNHEGKYSKVITFQLVNDDNKFEVKYVPKPKQLVIGAQEIKEDDPEIQVTLPKDQESLVKCIKSLFNQSKAKYKLKDQDLVKVLTALLNELKG